jgi:hypothetical protein
MRRAPIANLFFRPEEEHVASGENDIVPPPRSRNNAVEEPVRRFRPLERHIQVIRLAGLLATGVYPPYAVPQSPRVRPNHNWRNTVFPPLPRRVVSEHLKTEMPCGSKIHRPQGRATSEHKASDRHRAHFERPNRHVRPPLRAMACAPSLRNACKRPASPGYQTPSFPPMRPRSSRYNDAVQWRRGAPPAATSGLEANSASRRSTRTRSCRATKAECRAVPCSLRPSRRPTPASSPA